MGPLSVVCISRRPLASIRVGCSQRQPYIRLSIIMLRWWVMEVKMARSIGAAGTLWARHGENLGSSGSRCTGITWVSRRSVTGLASQIDDKYSQHNNAHINHNPLRPPSIHLNHLIYLPHNHRRNHKPTSPTEQKHQPHQHKAPTEVNHYTRQPRDIHLNNQVYRLGN